MNQPPTYGAEATTDQRHTCATCPGTGFMTTDHRPITTVQPCPTCRPIVYGRWRAGHLGCHRRPCEVCDRILAAGGYQPEKSGGQRWLED